MYVIISPYDCTITSARHFILSVLARCTRKTMKSVCNSIYSESRYDGCRDLQLDNFIIKAKGNPVTLFITILLVTLVLGQLIAHSARG